MKTRIAQNQSIQTVPLTVLVPGELFQLGESPLIFRFIKVAETKCTDELTVGNFGNSQERTITLAKGSAARLLPAGWGAR